MVLNVVSDMILITFKLYQIRVYRRCYFRISCVVCSSHLIFFLLLLPDGMATKNDPLCNPNLYMRGGPPDINKSRTQNENSFDLLLREAKAKLHKRKA